MPTLHRPLKHLSILIFVISILGTPLFAYPVSITTNVTFSALPGQPDPFNLAGTTGVITTSFETDLGSSGSYPTTANFTIGTLVINNQPGNVVVSANGQISATFGDGMSTSFSANLVIPPPASVLGSSFGASFSAPASSMSYRIGGSGGMVGITGVIDAVGLTAGPLSGISATAMVNGTPPEDGQISVGSNSGTSYAYTAFVSPVSASWLSVTNATGMAPTSGSALVRVHFSTGLPPGTYSASVLVNTTLEANGSIIIPVMYTVSAAALPPVISSMGPSSALAGGAAFPMTVNGSGFVPNSAVYWNGTALSTTFVSATQLTVMIPVSLIAFAGTAEISVVNPGNLASRATLTFTIISTAPTITRLVPYGATATGPPFTLTVNGTEFASEAVVLWNLAALPTTFGSSTQLTAAVHASLIAAAGSPSVTVMNPGGGSSAAVTFTITPAAPVITSLSPGSAAAGGPAFTLTVNGTGFLSGATVDWNGTALPTTLVSAMQLTAAVTASLIATQGSASITVVNPGGTWSSASAFPITPAGPVITSLTPTSAAAMGPAFTLCANGSSFVSGATLYWYGAALTTTFETTTQVCASVPANLITAKGSASITVVNPGGSSSGATIFTITPAAPVISGLSPGGASQYGPAFTLTVNGTGFLSGATVDWNGTALPTTLVSATQLTAAVTAISPLFPFPSIGAGFANITVVNPGDVTSSASTFTIFRWPPPGITSLSPSTAIAGGPAFTLTINGGEFFPDALPGTYVLWNNTVLPTSPLGNNTQLTATVPASLIAAAGSASVVVVNSSGGSSNAATFTISPAGPASPGSRFIPVSPCRLVDTRDAAGPFGGPFVPADGTRSFPIPSSSSCSVPGTALAYSLNLTVVPHGALGYVTLWPTGQAQPVVSTLNSLDGRVKANASIVPAGTNGAVSVFATDSTEVILDINGYFVPASDPSAEVFYPMTPCRLVDTRGVSPSVSTGALIGGTSRTLPLLSSSCNVPGTATAYSLNFTAIPANETLAYLTVYPTGAARPVVSTLNAPTGTIVANAALVPAGTAGSIDVYATDTTDLVVDINGYFAPPSTGGLSFYPVTPCRVLDSRNPAGTPPFMGAMNVDVVGSGCASPNTAQAYAFNATIVPPAALGYLTLWPEGGPQPVVSTLNALDGSITSNMAIVPASNNAISAYAANNTYLILDTSGYFAP